MVSEKVEHKICVTVGKFKRHSDEFATVDLTSLPFSDLDIELLNDNGLFLIADLFSFDFSILSKKAATKIRLLHIDKILNDYYYSHFFSDIKAIDFLERFDRRIIVIRLFPNSYLEKEIAKTFNISVRLYNCLKTAGIYGFSDIAGFDSNSIMSIENFGKKTAIELCEVLEDFIILVKYDNGAVQLEEDSIEKDFIIQNPHKDYSVFGLLSEQSDEFLDSNINVDLSEVRLANRLKEVNIRTYRDLLEFGEDQLWHIPNMGKKTIKKLLCLVRDSIAFASSDGSATANTNYDKVLNSLKNQVKGIIETNSDLSFQTTFRDIKLDLFFEFCKCSCNLTVREKDVLVKRNDPEHSMTLEQVSSFYNITRERIRQIEAKATKKIVSYFTRNDFKYDEAVNSFFGVLLEIDLNNIASCCYFLLTEEDILSKIVEISLINRLPPEHKQLFSLKKKKNYFFKALTSDFADMFSEDSKFLKCVENSELMYDIDGDSIKNMDSGIKADDDVYRFINKIKIKPNKTYRIIPYPLIEDYSCDFALVIEERLVILISLFDDVPHLICEDNLKRYQEFKRYCTEKGYGYAWCTPYVSSIYSLQTDRLSPKRTQTVIGYMTKTGSASFLYSNFFRRFNYTDEILGAILLQNNFKVRINPSRVVLNESLVDEKAVELDEYDEIKNYKFSNQEKNVLLAFLELEMNYSRSRRKRIYFGTLRVFLTGYEYSHLYEICREFKYFGIEKGITPASLKSVLNNFIRLGLIKEGLSHYGKTFYASNGKVISASRVLNRLLGVADSLSDYGYDLFNISDTDADFIEDDEEDI